MIGACAFVLWPARNHAHLAEALFVLLGPCRLFHLHLKSGGQMEGMPAAPAEAPAEAQQQQYRQ